MKKHSMKVVFRDGRLRDVFLDGEPITVAVGGLKIELGEGGLPVVTLSPLVFDLEIEVDEAELEHVEAIIADSEIRIVRRDLEGS